MNIWKKPLENGNFRTENVNKVGQKNDWIDVLERDFEQKNQLNWSFQSVAPSRMIYIRL